MFKNPILVYVLLVLYTIGPFILVAIASGVASHYGCKLDESGSHPCIVGGKDIGNTLVTLFTMGWFFLLTLPTGGAALVIYTIMLLASRRTGTPPPI